MLDQRLRTTSALFVVSDIVAIVLAFFAAWILRFQWQVVPLDAARSAAGVEGDEVVLVGSADAGNLGQGAATALFMLPILAMVIVFQLWYLKREGLSK